MIRCLALCLLSVLASPAWADEVEPPGDAKAEMRRRAGEWRVVVFERDGQKSPDAELKKMKVVLGKDGDTDFHYDGDVTRSRATLSPRKKPRQVDSLYLNSSLKG